MTELSPTARALVDAARDGLAPDPAAVKRMRANIAAAVGGGAVAVGGAKLALATKLAIVAAVAGALVGTYVLVRRSSPPVAAGVPHVSTTDDHVVTTPPAPAHVEAAPAIDDAIEIEPTSNARAAPSRSTPPPTVSSTPAQPPIVATTSPSANHAPTAPAAATTASPTADLAREVALVDQAMAALRDGDPNGALGAIRHYDLETRGKGQLAEDAAAIAVEAMCLRDDPSATVKLAAFDARWPHSGQRARVRATCQR